MRKQISLIIVSILACTMLVNCADQLNQAKAKNRDLGHMVEENMKTSITFQTNFVSFTNMDTGKYKCVTQGLSGAEAVGKFGYNAMIVLLERDNTKVKTGVNSFTIFGEQDGAPIFEVYATAGVQPMVTLKGKYEGMTWEPPKK